jgi:hypothetical protein
MGNDSAQDIALPATDESTLSPDTSFHPSTMVTLLVGPDEQEMTVHGDRLACNSAYFKAALRDEWLEGQTRVIKQATHTRSHCRLRSSPDRFSALSIARRDIRYRRAEAGRKMSERDHQGADQTREAYPKGSWRCMRRYCLSRHDCGIPCSPPGGRLRYGVYQRLLASHRRYWSA